MRPGWVRPCECGKVGRGVYCEDCRGFGDGMNGTTWERPVLEDKPRESAATVGGGGWESESEPLTTDSETFCPGGHRGATIRGNAAYCAECGGKIPPTLSSSYSHGTGH